MSSPVLTTLVERKNTLKHLVLTNVIQGSCSDEAIAKLATCPNLELADFTSCFDITAETLQLFKSIPVVRMNRETGQRRSTNRRFNYTETNSFKDFVFCVCDEDGIQHMEIRPGGHVDDCGSFLKFGWFHVNDVSEGNYEGNVDALRPVFLKLGLKERTPH